jgi:hypothetical protein
MSNKRIDSVVTCVLPERSMFGFATRQLITDLETYCRELDFNVEFCKSIPCLIFKVSSARSRITIFVYPGNLNPVVASLPKFIIKVVIVLVFRFLHAVGKKIILYVYDFPIEQNLFTWSNLRYEKLSRIVEKMLLDTVDVLLVFNELMASYISRRYNIRRDKFVLFEVLDYGTNIEIINMNRNSSTGNEVRIICASNFSNPRVSRIVKEFVMRCREASHDNQVLFYIVGKGGSKLLDIALPNVVAFEEMDPEELEKRMYLQCRFGLVLKISQYNEFGSTSKFSSYVHAGLPVVVPEEYVYLSGLVKKYRIGIVFKDCLDLINKLKMLTQEEYTKLSANVKRLGAKIRQGYFFKKALLQAFKLLHQKVS